MSRLEQYLVSKLDERKSAGNLRVLTTQTAAVDFFSNDYLGVATDDILSGLAKLHYSDVQLTGSTGSRLLSGNSQFAEALELTIATFHKAQAALLFNSGYDANMGLLSSIASRDTTIISDELCHASLLDGIRLSQSSRKYKFRHNDLADLAGKMERTEGMGPIIVVVESVYSMDGDMAPLIEISALCDRYDARLVVDEAHATGVIGRSGAGLVCELGLQDKVFARVHTFGKALGCHGAAVVGSNLLKEYLINFARTFIYTTALPGHSLVAAAAAYQYLSSTPFSNRELHELIAYFSNGVNARGMAGWIDSKSPIQVLVSGSGERCKALALRLRNADLRVSPILSPTVQAGKERLRVCLHTFNTRQQIDRLLDVLSSR